MTISLSTLLMLLVVLGVVSIVLGIVKRLMKLALLGAVAVMIFAAVGTIL